MEYESNGDKNKNLSLHESLKKIETYLRNIIINLQNFDKQKIQLTVTINFISSKDTEEERVMRLNSDNIKDKSYSEVNKVINELFKSFCSKYQENLKMSIKGRDFVFDSVQLMYYKGHKVNFKRGGSYVDYPGWIKKKKNYKSKK